MAAQYDIKILSLYEVFKSWFVNDTNVEQQLTHHWNLDEDMHISLNSWPLRFILFRVCPVICHGQTHLNLKRMNEF